jgi:hypothetical protein
VPVRFAALADVADDARALLAMLARAGAPDDDARALAAFAAGLQALGLPPVTAGTLPGCDVARMKSALLNLQALAPLQKPKLMLACAACALADRSVADAEAELMRAFGAAIDCPLPPLLAGRAERAPYAQNADGTSRRAAIAA